ncbi:MULTISPECIES: type II toxin-antitoxin system VapC family toxin [Cyanophyceae]|uniref:type II toxin-antitoxin system VapC family toxin n=1 Tax=Cyanophyceae TaxID=3028117 RepID=UPI00232CC9EE|nr:MULTISPECIES: type II toxin-antitoxin system VapC family toxin [Cyanophyceae]MDB9358588.1 type II toxin-antitoxin system VapC family toxin [Nodularia spumigena CS-587/03]MDB9303739.1 type II toxin-antitoxin system VapC family toxin [Nodularia spumigena CS-591/12]MDB9324068.1 type II toxin-antitoxin system VapC family toxin [Nodularia spumigena CS-591/07A]MDB9331212.1 type II toxin-antitoxin system VapC family toxin [Nodularia spumigena CS-591/04]MDB9341801.1 type II toxin-antitoxin system V
MKLLLDTHIFLWFISGDPKLPIHLQNSIRDLNNEVYLSCISVWETTVKYQLGKLPLPESPEIYLPKQRQQHLITSLNLDEQSIAQLVNLPLLHRDPFDRILICQALQHDMTIVSVDSAIRAYSVSILY